jgi:hypothetical protein
MEYLGFNCPLIWMPLHGRLQEWWIEETASLKG